MSAFSEHQTIGQPEGLVCHDPAEGGRLVALDHAEGGEVLWGYRPRPSVPGNPRAGRAA